MVQRKETQSSLNLFSVSRRNVMTSDRHIQAPAAAAGGAGGDSHSFFFATFSSTAFLLRRLVWRVHAHHPAKLLSTGGTEELYEENVAALWDITCSLQAAPPPPPHAQSCWCSPRRWGGEVPVPPSHPTAPPTGQTVFRFLGFLRFLRFPTFQWLQNTINTVERLILRWTASWSIPQIIHTHFIFRVTLSHRATPILT